MKKKKLYGKLNFSKSKISRLQSSKITGGTAGNCVTEPGQPQTQCGTTCGPNGQTDACTYYCESGSRCKCL